MNKLKFAKDEGSEFYKELNEKIEEYFVKKGIQKSGNRTMIFKNCSLFQS
jgi:linoleoyl-CoA desaturase